MQNQKLTWTKCAWNNLPKHVKEKTRRRCFHWKENFWLTLPPSMIRGFCYIFCSLFCLSYSSYFHLFSIGFSLDNAIRVGAIIGNLKCFCCGSSANNLFFLKSVLQLLLLFYFQSFSLFFFSWYNYLNIIIFVTKVNFQNAISSCYQIIYKLFF